MDVGGPVKRLLWFSKQEIMVGWPRDMLGARVASLQHNGLGAGGREHSAAGMTHRFAFI